MICHWFGRVALCAMAGLFCASPVAAAPLRLTIDEAVARALTGSADVSSSQKETALASANLARSRAWLAANPYASSGAQHSSEFGSNYWFSLAQEFEVAGQRGKRMETAAAAARKADWELRTAQQRTTAAVKTAFVQSLVSRERVTLAQKGLELASDLVHQLAGRATRELAQQVDLNSAKMQEVRSRRELAAAQRTRDDALDTLRHWADVPPNQDLELIGAPDYATRPLPAATDLIERALRERPDLVAYRHEADRTRSELALAKRSTIPNVSLSGTYLQFEGASLAGGEVTVPLPVFKSGEADTAEAAVENTFAAAALHAMERAVPFEVLEARRACTTAASDVQLIKDDLLPRSEDNVRLERQLYEKSVVSLSDFVEVQLDAIIAQRELLDAVETYNESLIELERVVGGPW